MAIGIKTRHVEPEHATERLNAAFVMDQTVEMGALGLGLFDRFADDDECCGQNFQMIWISPDLRHPYLHIGIEALAANEIRFCCKDNLGRFSGEQTPRFRGPGLENDRPSLDRASNVKRTANRKMRPFVIEHMHPVKVEIDSALPVPNDGILGKAVPQSGHHIIEFAGAQIRAPCSGCTSLPKFFALSGLAVVTTFQPAHR